MIADLNIKCNTIKLLEEIIGDNLHDLEFGSEFLDTTTKAEAIKEKIDVLDIIKI